MFRVEKVTSTCSLAFRQQSHINENLLLYTVLEKETLKCQLTVKIMIITENLNSSCTSGSVPKDEKISFCLTGMFRY